MRHPFRDMPGYARDKLQRAEGLKILLIATMTHFRTVDNRSCMLNIAQLGKREGITDNVLRKNVANGDLPICDINKKVIAYCIKAIDGRLVRQGVIEASRKALD
jgi:hypothetical protein